MYTFTLLQKSSFKRYEISSVCRRAIGHSPPNRYLQVWITLNIAFNIRVSRLIWSDYKEIFWRNVLQLVYLFATLMHVNFLFYFCLLPIGWFWHYWWCISFDRGRGSQGAVSIVSSIDLFHWFIFYLNMIVKYWFVRLPSLAPNKIGLNQTYMGPSLFNIWLI